MPTPITMFPGKQSDLKYLKPRSQSKEEEVEAEKVIKEGTWPLCCVALVTNRQTYW